MGLGPCMASFAGSTSGRDLKRDSSPVVGKLQCVLTRHRCKRIGVVSSTLQRVYRSANCKWPSPGENKTCGPGGMGEQPRTVLYYLKRCVTALGRDGGSCCASSARWPSQAGMERANQDVDDYLFKGKANATTRTCRRGLASMPLWRATMTTSATVRLAHWLELICSPARSMLWSRIAIAVVAENVYASSSPSRRLTAGGSIYRGLLPKGGQAKE